MNTDMRERMKAIAERAFLESIEAKRILCREGTELLVDMAALLAGAFRENRRLFIFGNGGSAADAQHLAAEFVNRFELERPPLPALALTVDSSVMTSIGNDFRFDDIFARQLQALAQPGDVALGISTSGRSPNVVAALRWAREHRVRTIGFCGRARSDMDPHCDLALHVPAALTARIQECHITAGHILCGLVEEMLFGRGTESNP